MKRYDQIMLIDGKNYCYRHHHSHKYLTSKGRSTGVLYGALSGLLSLARRVPHTPFVFVWDGLGRTWRHDLVEDLYKRNRQGPGNEDVRKVHRQLPVLKKFLCHLGFRQHEVPNLEADDLIGIIATDVIKQDLADRVIIHSTDKDFYQLVDDRIVLLRFPEKEIKFIGVDEICAVEGVHPKDWVKVRALTGDPTDDIPKIKKGLGPKTAMRMVVEGVDASARSFKTLPKLTRHQFPWLGPVWSEEVHRNYVLTYIARKRNYPMLPKDIQSKIGDVLWYKIRKGKFARGPRAQNDTVYGYITEFFAEYELKELQVRRDEFWSMI